MYIILLIYIYIHFLTSKYMYLLYIYIYIHFTVHIYIILFVYRLLQIHVTAGPNHWDTPPWWSHERENPGPRLAWTWGLHASPPSSWVHGVGHSLRKSAAAVTIGPATQSTKRFRCGLGKCRRCFCLPYFTSSLRNLETWALFCVFVVFLLLKKVNQKHTSPVQYMCIGSLNNMDWWLEANTPAPLPQLGSHLFQLIHTCRMNTPGTKRNGARPNHQGPPTKTSANSGDRHHLWSGVTQRRQQKPHSRRSKIQKQMTRCPKQKPTEKFLFSGWEQWSAKSVDCLKSNAIHWLGLFELTQSECVVPRSHTLARHAVVRSLQSRHPPPQHCVNVSSKFGR